ncbi:hypothetical protein FOA52_013714 [Chlamydomonas sp. UWO 241]|nr:hypothetical protein FOA52_013714 [Chlamydomonas sp. UWO 241]
MRRAVGGLVQTGYGLLQASSMRMARMEAAGVSTSSSLDASCERATAACGPLSRALLAAARTVSSASLPTASASCAPSPEAAPAASLRTAGAAAAAAAGHLSVAHVLREATARTHQQHALSTHAPLQPQAAATATTWTRHEELAHLSHTSPSPHLARSPHLLPSSVAWQGVEPLPTIRGYAQPRAFASLAYEQTESAPPASTSELQQPPRTLVLLHGLLGSGRNWRSFSGALVKAAAAATGSAWRVLLVDLRCHGGSTKVGGLNPPHSMQSAARDVTRLMAEVLQKEGGVPYALIGHSMGGKVALEALWQLASEGRRMPAQTWVLDSQPGKVPENLEAASGVARVLDVVHRVRLPVASRQALLDVLKNEHGLPEALSQWLGSNLISDDTRGQRWSFNVAGAAAMYHSYRLIDRWDVIESPPPGAEVHMVRGQLSDRFSPDMVARMRAAAAAGQQHAQHEGGPGAQTTPGSPGAQPLATPGAQPLGSTGAHANLGLGAPGAHTTPGAQSLGSPGAHANPGLGAPGRFVYHELPNAGHWMHTDNAPGLQALLLGGLLKGVQP